MWTNCVLEGVDVKEGKRERAGRDCIYIGKKKSHLFNKILTRCEGTMLHVPSVACQSVSQSVSPSVSSAKATGSIILYYILMVFYSSAYFTFFWIS
jgi:hypothetical protein